ncbi:MAG TPA: VanW family protein [Cyclobacteriaceae bacterium]|nr:VanW family protein [Cyclobacteriaceae bacterium]
MTEREILTEDHGLLDEITFRFKAAVLIVIRFFKNSTHYRTARFSTGHRLKNEQVISVSETDLWNTDDTELNWILTAGKIQNLRIAAKQLHGTEVPANEVFSFWKHIGAPVTRRGYVIGREIREGCIVPAVAGGLCQLSNALYDNAVKAGFEIIERHKHTRVVKGSLAEVDRDATVKWNYIDLRFRSRNDFRIETELTADQLLVKFKSTSRNGVHETPLKKVTTSILNDCYSCGNFECFKHPKKIQKKEQASSTTFVLDGKWSEYDEYVKSITGAKDHFILPGKLSTISRSLKTRVLNKLKRNVFSTSLELDRQVAKKIIKRIPIESTHLVVSQNLLPFLWEEGALGGRTFDVLMTRLPMEKLHERLDHARARYPQSPTLSDFRADAHLVDLENAALTKARNIITPHQEIADIFKNKSVNLNWKYPANSIHRKESGTKILFPGSSLARKGAYEMRQLAVELKFSVKVLGGALEEPSFWNGMSVEKAGADPFENVGLVVYPVYVEHQPRVLLKAVSAGIPVVTTTASGLRESEYVTIVPTGDYDALKRAVVKRLHL